MAGRGKNAAVNGRTGDTGAASANAIEYAKRNNNSLLRAYRFPIRKPVNRPIATIAAPRRCSGVDWSPTARSFLFTR